MELKPSREESRVHFAHFRFTLETLSFYSVQLRGLSGGFDLSMEKVRGLNKKAKENISAKFRGENVRN